MKHSATPLIEHPASPSINALAAVVHAAPVVDDGVARYTRVMQRLQAVDGQRLAFAEMAAAVAIGATFTDTSLSVPELERIASIAESNGPPRLRPSGEHAQ